MVELVEVAEGVHHGLEDRFPKIGVDIYTKSIHKNFLYASSKMTNLFFQRPLLGCQVVRPGKICQCSA